MDTEPLRQSDLIIVSSMTKTPGYNPDQMIGEFCMNTGITQSLFSALEHALNPGGGAHVIILFAKRERDRRPIFGYFTM